MDHLERLHRVNLLLTNGFYCRVDQKSYILRNPSFNILSAAESFYRDTVRECRFDVWLTEGECRQILIKTGQWSQNSEKDIEQVEKQLEDAKVTLYRGCFTVSKLEPIRRSIERLRKRLNRAISIKHSLDHLTLKGFAFGEYHKFIVKACLYDGDKKIEPNDNLINGVLFQKSESGLVEKQIRELARTEPWRTYWNIGKPNPFKCHICELGDEQKALVAYSKMYDNAFENSDCPAQKIINDDDMFDGWLIIQKRQREKAMAEQRVNDSLGNKQKDADEIFIPVRTKEDMENIQNMNSPTNQMIQKQRFAKIKQQGKAEDKDFIDVKMGVGRKTRQQFMDKVKSK